MHYLTNYWIHILKKNIRRYISLNLVTLFRIWKIHSIMQFNSQWSIFFIKMKNSKHTLNDMKNFKIFIEVCCCFSDDDDEKDYFEQRQQKPQETWVIFCFFEEWKWFKFNYNKFTTNSKEAKKISCQMLFLFVFNCFSKNISTQNEWETLAYKSF